MLGYESNAAVDESLDALRDAKRRRLLFTLLEETEDAGSEARCDVKFVFDDDENSRIELVHVHLPKLADLGFIDWEMGDRTVEPGARWKEIRPILSVLHDHLDELPPPLRGTPATGREQGV